VSTEVDARLSFDVAATIAKAKKIIALYAEHVRICITRSDMRFGDPECGMRGTVSTHLHH